MGDLKSDDTLSKGYKHVNRKTPISLIDFGEEQIDLYNVLFPFKKVELDEGLKYLGLMLEPNN